MAVGEPDPPGTPPRSITPPLVAVPDDLLRTVEAYRGDPGPVAWDAKDRYRVIMIDRASSMTVFEGFATRYSLHMTTESPETALEVSAVSAIAMLEEPS